jgi:hypothetical protein
MLCINMHMKPIKYYTVHVHDVYKQLKFLIMTWK